MRWIDVTRSTLSLPTGSIAGTDLSSGTDWRNPRTRDGLAIILGVGIICLFAYVNEFLPQPFQFGMGNAGLEVDDIIVAMFLISIQVAIVSHRLHARS